MKCIYKEGLDGFKHRMSADRLECWCWILLRNIDKESDIDNNTFLANTFKDFVTPPQEIFYVDIKNGCKELINNGTYEKIKERDRLEYSN